MFTLDRIISEVAPIEDNDIFHFIIMVNNTIEILKDFPQYNVGITINNILDYAINNPYTPECYYVLQQSSITESEIALLNSLDRNASEYFELMNNISMRLHLYGTAVLNKLQELKLANATYIGDNTYYKFFINSIACIN